MSLHITIDNREQQPWYFGDYAKVSRGTLGVGDYAVTGDSGYAVERKSLPDFVGTVSSGWARFRREIERSKEIGFPNFPIIIEANFSDLFPLADGSNHYNHPQVKSPFIFRRIGELTLLGASVIFAGDPIMAAGLCWKLLSVRKDQLDE